MTISLMPLQTHFDNITEDIKELFERVNKLEVQPIITPHSKQDTPSPHESKNKFSPIMIEMLLFAYHSGDKFSEFPNLRCPAQQRAYNFFLVNDYFYLRAFTPIVALTEKGKALVEKILKVNL